MGLKLDPETTLAKFSSAPANLVKGICSSFAKKKETPPIKTHLSFASQISETEKSNFARLESITCEHKGFKREESNGRRFRNTQLLCYSRTTTEPLILVHNCYSRRANKGPSDKKLLLTIGHGLVRFPI